MSWRIKHCTTLAKQTLLLDNCKAWPQSFNWHLIEMSKWYVKSHVTSWNLSWEFFLFFFAFDWSVFKDVEFIFIVEFFYKAIYHRVFSWLRFVEISGVKSIQVIFYYVYFSNWVENRVSVLSVEVMDWSKSLILKDL